MVVRLDREDRGQTVADVDGPRILAWAAAIILVLLGFAAVGVLRFWSHEQRLNELKQASQAHSDTSAGLMSQMGQLEKRVGDLQQSVVSNVDKLVKISGGLQPLAQAAQQSEARREEILIEAGLYDVVTPKPIQCPANTTLSVLSLERRVRPQETRLWLQLSATGDSEFVISAAGYVTDNTGKRYTAKAKAHDRTHVTITRADEEIIVLHRGERFPTFITLGSLLDPRARELQLFWPNCGILDFTINAQDIPAPAGGGNTGSPLRTVGTSVVR
jgi:hypothetical protein